MALWTVTKTNTYLDTGRQQVVTLGTFDDAIRPTNQDLLNFFGVTERNNVQIDTPSAGVITATIQWSNANPTPTGWERDREAPYSYIVQFRAVRQG
jgi:hypothetical protein